MIRFIHDDKIEILSGLKYLWGFRIESGTDEKIFPSPDEVEKIIKRTKASSSFDNIFFVVIKRTRIKNYPDDWKDAYKTEVFYFFFNYNLMLSVMEIIPSAKKMTGSEIAKALFKCQTLIDDYYLEDKQIKTFNIPNFTKSTIFIPPVGKTFFSFFRNQIEKKKSQGLYPFFIYKGSRPTGGLPDTEDIFSGRWTGSLWIKFNFNNIYSVIKGRVNAMLNTREAKFWKDFAEDYKANKKIVCLIETTLITEEEDAEIISLLFKRLAMEYVEWEVNYETIIKSTPLLKGEENFEIVVYPDFASKLMPTSFAKNSAYALRETIYGRNKDGEFVSYSPFKEAQSPHMTIIAPTRSGKSFMTQNFVCTMAGIDVDALFNGTVENKELPIWIRYFDVGFSAEFLVNLLDKRGFSVAIMNPKPDIKINLIEMDNIVEELDAVVGLINITLETKKEEPLNAREEGLFRKIVQNLYENPELKQDYYVEWLRSKYPKYYELAKRYGYKDGDLLKNLKEPEFRPLHYPTLADVLREIGRISNEEMTMPEEKETAQTLMMKIKTVRSIQNFANFSDIEISGKKFVYIDLNYFKKSPNFVPIYSAILTKIIRKLQKEDVSDTESVKLFICDEFHNVIKKKVFKDFFEVLAREAAKYNIYLVLITQNPSDIPREVANNIATKIFLKPASDTAGRSPTFSFEEEVREKFQLNETALKELRELPKYTPLFLYPSGFFTMQMPLTKIKSQVFESRSIVELKTPDGIVIRKTYAQED